MPSRVSVAKKRTRAAEEGGPKSTKRRPGAGASPEATPDKIAELEAQIVESTEHYNNIVHLLAFLEHDKSQIKILTAAALCRTFSRLMAARLLRKDKALAGAQETVVAWLRERYRGLKTALVALVGDSDEAVASAAVTVLVRLVREESTHSVDAGEYFFAKPLWTRTVAAVLATEPSALVEEVVTRHVSPHDDLRYHFFQAAAETVASTAGTPEAAAVVANVLAAIGVVEGAPEATTDLAEPTFLVDLPEGRTKQPLRKVSAHKAAFEDMVVAVLSAPLEPAQFKLVLQIMHKKIVPRMARPPLLMDFLTDCYDVGGSVSLLALNALFFLIQKHNLDYPNFYPKLYALLDRNVLHVRYVSRFVRLLDLFLSSTHLPSALVAAFIKRLARLALSAPPAAIVIVVPFIYNQLKRHPACNVLIHQTDPDVVAAVREADPYDPSETDPARAHALDGSLWEIAVLQSHYHPNVATLARIMSEPFIKPAYNMEDFLDHSYATMLDQEFAKNIRNPPAVEHEVEPALLATADAYLPGWQL
ncbi:CBF/Mak21 family-domain-containing protein [Dipodascopsis tothii]|uniref:CBF/Mak21 family-domain-containing protein n=1 Tax=Dipodascopsis tothii TaxID=44089 RepID=UPI0034CE7E4E